VGKNKYTKILNHLKSEEIDHKISLLNERMTSSGFYFTTGLDSGVPAVPEVPAVPAVPPTYENVTGGLSNANDFVWGGQGDGSNPDAPVNVPANLYTTYNGEQVAATRQIEGTYPAGVTPVGYVIRDGWLSTNYVGYLGSGGFTSVASVGVFANSGSDLGNAYQQAYYNWPYPGKIVKTIYLWGSLDCLFGSCKGGIQYSPSNLSNTSTPKADRALYPYTLWIAADANGNPLPNRIMTDPGVPEIPAIPAVPAIPPKPIVLDRYNLGDPNYYAGPIKTGLDLLKNIGKALDEFGRGAEKAINNLGQNIRSAEINTSKQIAKVTDGIKDGMNLFNNVKNIIESAKLGPQDSSGRYTLIPNSIGTINNPLQNRVSSSTQEYLLSGYDPKIDGSIGSYLQRQTSRGIEQGGNIGAKGTHNNITGQPYIDNQGNIRIPDTYGFGPSQEIYNKPVVKQTVDVISAIAGALGGEKAKKETSENVQTFFDQSAFGLIPGTPGKNAPLVHFETVIPAKDAQKLAPNYKNQPVKEETLFEKFKKQNQTVENPEYINEFALLIGEIKSLPEPIKKYLLLEFETSIKLSTLSPQERRFKEQEIKNNLLVKTSELYVNTHFPENEKLFKRLQKSIKKNIELTDPKTFKNPAGVMSYKQLVAKDFVNENNGLEEKKYVRRKDLVKKLFKKPERKKSLVDDKLNYLNNEMKKTGML
jgi:hypothetical protein